MFGIGGISDPAGEARGMPGGDSRSTPSRLDALLVERGLAENRSRAQALIMAGAVRVGGEVVMKAGFRAPPGSELSVEPLRQSTYVSRGGEKLAHALDEFGIKVWDRECLDAGASTGGFTDVLLRRETRRTIAVDVGYGQLDWSLRNDPRVFVMERTNVRHLSGGDLPFAPDLLVADLSFISLAMALENLLSTTPSISEAVLLVKPQFEAGPERVSRGGLVRDATARAAAVHKVIKEFEAQGFGTVSLARSPVAGRRAGNVEYPLWLLRDAETMLEEERILAVTGGGEP